MFCYGNAQDYHITGGNHGIMLCLWNLSWLSQKPRKNMHMACQSPSICDLGHTFSQGRKAHTWSPLSPKDVQWFLWGISSLQNKSQSSFVMSLNHFCTSSVSLLVSSYNWVTYYAKTLSWSNFTFIISLPQNPMICSLNENLCSSHDVLWGDWWSTDISQLALKIIYWLQLFIEVPVHL